MSHEPPGFASLYESSNRVSNPVLRVLWTYGGPYLPTLLLALATATIGPLVTLVPAYLLGVAVTAVVDGPSAYHLAVIPETWIPSDLQGQFLFTMGLLVTTQVFAVVVQSVDSLAWSWLQHNATHDLRTDTFDATQNLGMAFFTTSQTGDVMSVLNNDVEQLDAVFGNWLTGVLRLVVLGVGMAIVMMAMHWQLGAIAIGLTLPAAVLTVIFNRYVSPRYTDLRAEAGQYNARLENSISGVGTVKAYDNEEHELGRVEASSRTFRDASLSVGIVGALYYPGLRLLTESTEFLVFFVGGWIALFGPPTPAFNPVAIGTFLTFFFYVRRYTDEVSNAGGFVDTYSSVTASARRVFGLVEYPTSVDEVDDPIDLPVMEGRVTYEDVTFRYPGTDDPALKNVSLAVEPGEFVGVVGPTGAGKTTLAKLLIRFYDPDDGTVRLDGHPLRSLSLEALRGSIGYVSQEPFLFDDTVHENIEYAAQDVSEEAVIEAAKRANAHEFITDLENGYDTTIGERGVTLSGGQRQRLSIARAILRDPEILILDEATSHVDNRTELLIQRGLNELVANRTTLAIAHRLSTVRDADQLVVLDDGEIVERGTHEELREADGLYAGLWSAHVGNKQA